ncbi:sensor histidine kinase [Octadecabacter sp. R77987]|uniref:sensor histidine kinase n=1 Tax=Octadecabacter sp. R77987 TaxID=3093874 RepID=UPI00366E8BA7
MSGQITRKWRPTLALFLGCMLVAVLALPFLGFGVVRVLCVPLRPAFIGEGWPTMSCTNASILITFLVIAATAVLGWMMWRVLLNPITALAERAHEIKNGEDAALAPLSHYGTAEMRDMGQSILDMGHVLLNREAVLRSYADHVTHELKSPLTVIRGATELLAAPDLPADARARLLAQIDAATTRMTALLDAQRALARAQEPLVEGTCRITDLAAGLRQDFPTLEITVEGGDALPLPAERMRLVLDHLLGNAGAHGATKVTITARDGRDLTVADNGNGVTDGNRARIFDPFFTTRRDAGGTGMGLPIVARMLEAHSASIALAKTVQGATFVVRFSAAT